MVWDTRLTTFLALAALSLAEQLDAWAPTITYPHQGVTWNRGESHHCKWITSNAPPLSNPHGAIYLVNSASQLLIDKPLAQGFDILDGSAEFVVPEDIDPGVYQIDLMGDSGDWSEPFNIE